jgi:sugar-specific transcriptional regulator TrmB
LHSATAALALGPSPVLSLARAAEMRRTTAYAVLDSLQRYGLMHTEIRGLKRFFVAESPEKVEKILDQRRSTFREHLPELLALHNLRGESGMFQYFEGLSALKNVYEELFSMVRPGDDYQVVSNLDQWFSADPNFFESFISRRARLNIRIRILAIDSSYARKRKNEQQLYHNQIKILPPGTKLSTNLVVIPRRLVIHQLNPPVMAIVTSNQSIIQMHRELFDIIWSSLPS